MQMKWQAALLMAIALGGCKANAPDKAQELAACQAEANRFFQTYKTVDPDDPSSRYIIGCMAAKGYDFTIETADCDSRHPLPIQPACYAPASWIDWLIDQARRILKLN
jgi:hypothetical protein